MTDRLDEIRADVESASKYISLTELGTPQHVLRNEAIERVRLHHAPYLLAEIERLRAAAERAFGNVNARNETLEAEVERLRAALTDVSFRCERCGLDFAADGIDATNRCYQCHNDVHFGQPTVQWNPILDDIGNTTITKGGES